MLADWKHGPYRLTYRQAEYTFGLVAGALAKDHPDGLPSRELQGICDSLLEASIPGQFKNTSTSQAADWTDLESFSRPPPRGTTACADPEASWGHRKNNLLRGENELFYGYYTSASIMTSDENGAAVPEFARRATVPVGARGATVGLAGYLADEYLVVNENETSADERSDYGRAPKWAPARLMHPL